MIGRVANKLELSNERGKHAKNAAASQTARMLPGCRPKGPLLNHQDDTRMLGNPEPTQRCKTTRVLQGQYS